MKYVKKYDNFKYNLEKEHDININKPTRVTNKKATAIYYILTNSYTEAMFNTAKLKCERFRSIFYLSYHTISEVLNKKIIFTKDHLQSNVNFKMKSFEIDRQEIETIENSRDTYTYFLEQFLSLYDTFLY